LLNEITLTAAGNKITPRDYQIDALEHALTNGQSLLLSPTASGKSLIIYLAIRHFLEESDQSVLLIVPTTSLVEQMYSDFADYSQFDEWEVAENCHKIYAGKEKYNVKPRVIITTWQSIYKERAEWFHPFGMVVGDEAHAFKAKSLTSILEKCTECRYRMGTTGTLDGTQTHQLVLEGLFGPVHKVTTTKKLMDSNDLAQLDINVLLLKYADEHCRVKRDYQQEMDFIVKYDPRNNFISNLAIDCTGNTIPICR
jgi:superfamily II DNA or RNA helicase